MFYAIITISSEAYNEACAVRGNHEEIENAFAGMCETAFYDAALLEGEYYESEKVVLPKELTKMRRHVEQAYGGVVAFEVLEESFDEFIDEFNAWCIYQDDDIVDAEDTEEFFDELNDMLGKYID